MNVKRLSVALLAGLLGAGAARAQLPGFDIRSMPPSPVSTGELVSQLPAPNPTAPNVEVPFTNPLAPRQMTPAERLGPIPVPPVSAAPQPPTPPAPTPAQGMFTSAPLPYADGMHAPHWLSGSPADCCGPVGCHGPIGSELYLLGGFAFGISGQPLDNQTQLGYTAGAGFRTLLYNTERNAAWAVDAHVLGQYNNGEGDSGPLPLPNIGIVTVRDLHRKSFGLGLGRHWWMLNPADCCDGPNWRVGFDVGGRYGTARANFNIVGNPNGFAKTDDVTGGMFLALSNFLEIPVGGWHAVFGVRCEYGYTWGDVLSAPANQIHDLNLFLTGGIRF